MKQIERKYTQAKQDPNIIIRLRMEEENGSPEWLRLSIAANAKKKDIKRLTEEMKCQ